jgi:RNA polymerase sigma-70 factor (ECF subfamily)
MNRYQSLSDEHLMSHTAKSDEAAFEHLYDRYAGKAMGFIHRIVQDQGAAAEIMQELFIRLWDSRAQYDPSKARFTTWMFGIARNLAIDHYRRMQNRPSALQQEDSEHLLEQTPDQQPNVADQVSRQMVDRRLAQAVQELPDEQRRIIEHAYFQGLTRQQIAVALDIPLGTVHSRARLALKKLGHLLKDLQGEHG